MLKKLPIGIQTFRKIIEGNFAYVDKTKIAHDLISSAGYYFLSRPRRFGKSLFLDTLREIFLGGKELFEGLYIYDKWDWEEKYPVMRISMGSGSKTQEGLREDLILLLKEEAERLGVQCEDLPKPKHYFSCLIKEAHEKYRQKVVILIDEYDKPILDNITNPDTARLMRDELKESDYYIPELLQFKANEEILSAFDVDYIDLVALLWQTGYLTITSREEDALGVSYCLSPPNKEVKLSLNNLFINYLKVG